MDLLEHAAGVWARKYLVVGIAVLVAVGVYGWRSSAPEEYYATTILQVRLPDTQTSDPSDQVAFYAQTASGLTTSRSVVGTALEMAGRGDDVDDAVDSVSAAEGSDPGFLTIEAFGGSPREAAELTDALGEVLIEQVAADQVDDVSRQRAAVTQALAELGRDRDRAVVDGADTFEQEALDREREVLLGSLRTLSERTPWRLAVVEPAVAPNTPAAPTPTRDALLALILALILGAELVVARRAWRGSLSARDPGKDAGDVAGVPGLALRADQSAAALTPLLPPLALSHRVNVVQRGPYASARTAGLLAELLAARGDDVLLVDANVARPAVHAEYDISLAPGLAELRRGVTVSRGDFEGLPHVQSLSLLPAGEAPRARGDRSLAEVLKGAPQDRVTVATSIGSVDELLDVVADLEGPVVLDVAADTTKRQLRTEVDTLRGLGLDLVAVTVSTGSRRGRGRTRRTARKSARSGDHASA